MHKSVRGSDPDAGLYWLARMLAAGEDALYIGRRIIRMATEDVGLADPLALPQAVSAFQCYQILGSPEGELALAQAVVYLALAPKSNAIYTAYKEAGDLAAKTGTEPVPLHIRNAPTGLLKKLGYGRSYRYPHDYPDAWVAETYLPAGLAGSRLYHPTARGWEGKWRGLLAQRRRQVEQQTSETERKQGPGSE
jgi:putative ATPase